MQSHTSERIVVIGSGIIGLTHALVAKEAGYLLERNTRPLGASAMGGLGTTLSWGLAEQTVRGWQTAPRLQLQIRWSPQVSPDRLALKISPINMTTSISEQSI